MDFSRRVLSPIIKVVQEVHISKTIIKIYAKCSLERLANVYKKMKCYISKKP